MRIRSFEFNLRELAGVTGDLGILFPLAIGYIVVCGLDPAGFLVTMGLASIATGLVFRLPMPIEPMKVLATVAIAQAWSPSLIISMSLFDRELCCFMSGRCGDRSFPDSRGERRVMRP